MAEPVDTTESDLDLLRRYVSEFDDATQLQRAEGARARDYKDGIQWTSEELAKKAKRKEPALVFNYVAQKINFLVGSEIRARVDPKCLPRTPAEESETQAATDALRYVSDDQKIKRIRTELAEELLLPGYAAAVLCADTSRPKWPKITVSFIRSDNFFYDPHSSKADYSDAKYLGDAKWWDLEDLKADPQYSKAGDVIDGLAGNAEELASFGLDKPELWADTERNRVQVFEIYYQQGGNWKTAHFCYAGFLVKPQKVKYVDEDGANFCPVIGATAFITRDNVRYGLCRNLFDPQDEVNHRRSKALRDMSVKGFVAERGAVLNPTEVLTELAKPDCAAIVEDDALKDGRFVVRDGQEMAAGQLQLLGEAKAAIDSIGPSLSSIAQSNSDSGRAIMARQNIASIEMEPLFDHLRDWQERLFRAIWWMIRQFWTDEIWLRVTDSEERTGYKFVGLNRSMTRAERLDELMSKGVPPASAVKMIGLEPFEIQAIQSQAQEQATMMVVQRLGGRPQDLPPEAQQQLQPVLEQLMWKIGLENPRMREKIDIAHLGRLSMDIIVDTAPEIATIQQEQFELLADMIGKGLFAQAPELVELALSASQLRDKDKLIDKLQKAREAPQPGQQMQIHGQMALMQANLAKLAAQVEEVKSQTVLNLANAQARGAAAQSEMAYAISTMQHAGRESVPTPPVSAGQQQRQGGVNQ